MDRQVYVLKLPLRVGATWDAGQGATAEVTDLDKRMSTLERTPNPELTLWLFYEAKL